MNIVSWTEFINKYSKSASLSKLEPTQKLESKPTSKEPVLVIWCSNHSEDAYEPTELLLSSILRAKQDRKEGKSSPIFSSADEMEKWLNEHDE